MGRKLQVIAPKQGVVAHRERAVERKFDDAGSSPACEAPYLWQYLPIKPCRMATLALPRRQTASANSAIDFALFVGYSRSSTAIERPKQFGERGFDSHRERHFRRAVEFGLSVKRETASGFEPCTIGKPMAPQLALCPSYWPCASTFRRVAGLGYRS